MTLRTVLERIVEAWFNDHSDSSDAGYSVVTHDDLPALVDKLHTELAPAVRPWHLTT